MDTKTLKATEHTLIQVKKLSEEKVVTKIQKATLFLAKHWFWIVLLALIIAGCYLTASYLLSLRRKTEKEAKE